MQLNFLVCSTVYFSDQSSSVNDLIQLKGKRLPTAQGCVQPHSSCMEKACLLGEVLPVTNFRFLFILKT